MAADRFVSIVLAVLVVTVAFVVPASGRTLAPWSDSLIQEWRSERESLSADRVLAWPVGHHVGGLGYDHRNARLLVTDRTEHAIRVYDSNDTFVETIGSRGAAPGQFEAPGDVAAVPGVGMAVSDTGNDRIQILDDHGAWLRSWPVPDPRGLLVQQVGMADANLWVVSPSSSAVYQYDVSGALENQIAVGETSAPGVPEPVGLSSRGSWVADRGIGEVRLVATGADHAPTLFELPGVEAAGTFPGTGFGLAGAPGLGLVPVTGYRGPGRSIRFERVLDLEGGTDNRVFAAVEPEGVVALDDPEATVGGLLDRHGQLVHPRRVAAGATIILADALPRLQVWSRSGVPQRSIDLDAAQATERDFPPADVAASGSRQYALLGAYALDAEFPGRIYTVEDDALARRWPVSAVAISAHGDDLAVLDVQHQTVEIFHEPSGASEAWALDATGFRAVMDIGLASDHLFLANHETGEVERWSRDGLLLARWPVLGGAIRMATDPAGRAYVLSGLEHLTVYDPTGSLLASGSVRVPGNSAADLAVDEEGRVYVAYRDDLVAVHDPAGASNVSPPPVSEPTSCTVLADKQASPRKLVLGASTTVELGILGACPADPPNVDAVLVIDIDDYDSDPWLPDDELSTLKREAISIIGFASSDRWRIGAVTGGRTPTRVSDLSNDKSDLVRRVLDVYQRDERHVLAAGIQAAVGLLREQGRPGATPAVLVLANSKTIDQGGLDEAIGALRSAGIAAFTVGVGPRPDAETLRRIAGSHTRYYRNPTDVEVAEIVRGVEAAAMLAPGARLLASAVVTDVVPSNMRFIPGSGRPTEPGFDPASRTLTWTLQDVGAVGARLSYRLQPEEPGLWPTNDSAAARLVDALGVEGRLWFPVPSVEVIAPPPTATPSLPTPTPTPTATQTPEPPPTDTPAPSATPLPSASASPTPTIQPTATATPSPAGTPTDTPLPPTPRPAPIYLPIGLRESCPPKNVYLDVILVIDASTSMLESTSLGRPKIDVAKESTALFLTGLRLEAGLDRAAIVAFNQEARILQTLTSDRAALQEALGSIRLAEQSRVDLGVDRATVELVTGGRPGHLGAMVVLSDGRANPASGDEAIAAARRARIEGITLYVVGLGPAMDERVLRAMAADEARYFAAPDPDTIPAIFRDLTRHVACPPEVFWGKR